MDFNIGNKKSSNGNSNLCLPPPENLNISFPKKPGHIMVTWNEVDHPDNYKIQYNIYRGESSNGIFYKQNGELLDTNHYEDANIINNPNITYWYKVSTIYNNGDKKIESELSKPTKYYVNNTNRWFKKMNERNMWILKNTGQLFDLYVRKYEGEKCPKCYDNIRARSANSNCNVCFGTGIKGGYEPMFQLYMRLKPVQQSLDIGNHGFQINSSPGAWTISSTQIKNRDILISPQGIIYSVTSSHINQAAGYLFHQELQLKELERTDPLYNLKRETLYPAY